MAHDINSGRLERWEKRTNKPDKGLPRLRKIHGTSPEECKRPSTRIVATSMPLAPIAIGQTLGPIETHVSGQDKSPTKRATLLKVGRGRRFERVPS